MPYTRGPYAQHSSLPSPDVTTIPVARKINFATKRYELDANGNYVAMNATAQRVMIALAFGAPNAPRFITDQDMEKRRQQINTALIGLVAEGAIEVTSVEVWRSKAGEGKERVRFINRATGIGDSVTRP
jgi:hypothetical protein